MGALLSFLAYAVIITVPLVLVMSFFRSRNNFPVKGRTAIVTGGSQGLGLAIARKLASKGSNVVIVAQDVSKLEKALDSIRNSALLPSQRFLQLSYDLRSPDSATKIISEVKAWNNEAPPDILFCCAGNCQPGFFADMTLHDLRSQMDTVYWSCAYMAHAVLNLWTKPSTAATEHSSFKHARHIVFTSSVLSFLPMAGYTAYSPAKAAMRSLADSLNQEVAVYNGSRQNKSLLAPDADIKIHTIFPMGILSPGLENENKIKPELTRQLEKDDKPQTPEDVATASFDGLEAGEFMITTQFIGHMMKGWGMGGSVRTGFKDLLWNWAGSLVVIFVALDMISKCRQWGKQNGMKTSPAQV